MAASVGGITWMILDYRLERKWSAVGFCSGAVSGLVAITPASGFVGPPAALVFGVVGAIVCNFATRIKVGFSFTLLYYSSQSDGWECSLVPYPS